MSENDSIMSGSIGALIISIAVLAPLCVICLCIAVCCIYLRAKDKITIVN